MVPPIIEAINLSKFFPRRSGILRREIGSLKAVDNVSCALRPGETLGLVGESGCGKTTLAKLLVGLLTPSRGEVLIKGASLAQLRKTDLLQARRAIQFIFQDPTNSLNPRMSVGEILSEPFIIHRLAQGSERRLRVEALLRAVQLPAAYRQRLPRELSGGERQRVGIARALATEPQALICDEPIASLDVSVGAQIVELLRALSQQRRMALLFISHDLRAVASLCQRIAVMRQGCFIEVADTDKLLSHPSDPYTELLIRCAELDLGA
jgi:ABC-type glutathione transport system ATPase component